MMSYWQATKRVPLIRYYKNTYLIIDIGKTYAQNNNDDNL